VPPSQIPAWNTHPNFDVGEGISYPLSHFSMGEGWGEDGCGALPATGPQSRSDLKPHCPGKKIAEKKNTVACAKR
jgi:hypothetical protein